IDQPVEARRKSSLFGNSADGCCRGRPGFSGWVSVCSVRGHSSHPSVLLFLSCRADDSISGVLVADDSADAVYGGNVPAREPVVFQQGFSAGTQCWKYLFGEHARRNWWFVAGGVCSNSCDRDRTDDFGWIVP